MAAATAPAAVADLQFADHEARFCNEAGRRPPRRGEFCRPRGACSDHPGNIYVVDYLSQGRVIKPVTEPEPLLDEPP